MYTGHNSLLSASSCRRTALRCTTLQICDHYNTIYYIRYIILYSLCRAHLKSVMASTKCSFPSCESDVSAKVVSSSESESEILQLRFGSDMKCLCDPHYSDQFKKYNSWHSRKCSDPCVTHTKPKKTRLSLISLDTARSVHKYTDYRVIPGQSLCQVCKKFLSDLVKEAQSQESEGGGGCFSGDLPMQEDSP